MGPTNKKYSYPLGLVNKAVPYLFVAAAYVAAGKLGLSLASINPSATAVWPPTGIAIAAFLLMGYRVWPAVLLAAFVVNQTTTGSVGTSLGIAIGNTLEGLTAGFLITRFANGRKVFDDPKDFFQFILFAGILSSAISATVGVTTLAIGGAAPWANYWSVWITWWLGDAAGALVVAPAIVLTATTTSRWTFLKTIEGIALLTLLIAFGRIVFGDVFAIGTLHFSLEYLCFPILLWTAFRFTPREAALATFLLFVLALWGTINGFGPFQAENSAPNSLLLLQVFTGLTSVMTLSLSILVADRKRVEATLRTSEEHYRNLVENINEAYYLSDHVGRMSYGSPNLYTETGYAPSELLGQLYVRLIGTEDLRRVVRFYEQCVADGTVDTTCEFRVRRKDGSLFWVEQSTRIIRDERGNVQHFRNIVRSIADRKKAENALRESEARYRILVERMSEGLLRVDNNDVIQFANDRFCEMVGYTADELLGNIAADLLLLPLDHAPMKERNIKRTQGLSENYELQMRRKSGKLIWVRVGGAPVFDADGRSIGSIGVHSDITERKREHEQITLLAHAVESTSELICITDVNDEFIFANSEFLKVYGYTEAEILGKRPNILRSPSARAGLSEEIWNQTLRGEWSGELLNVRKDGTEFPVYLTTSQIKDADGKMIGLIGIARDITARKRAENALRVSERKYRDIFELAPFGIYQSLPNGRFITANLTLAQMLGYETVEDLLEVDIDRDVYVDRDERSKLIGQYDSSEYITDLELEWKKRDATSIWVLVNAHSVKNAEGLTLYFEGFVRDVTLRKQAETLLRNSEERYRNLVENISEAYFVCDTRGRVNYASPNFFFHTGYTRAEILGKSYHRLIGREDRARVIAYYVHRTEDGTVDTTCEFRGRHKDGRSTWLEQSTRIVRDANGTATEYRNVIRDISKRKQAEEARAMAENANLAKSQFLATVSHELRTPLNSVIGFAGVLLKKRSQNKFGERETLFLERILENGKHLLMLINQILDLAKVEGGRMELELTPVSLSVLVHETLEQFEGRLEESPITLAHQLPHPMALLETDYNKLKQVLINLVANALKFTERGSVTIRVGVDPSTRQPLRIDVVDTGIGIPEQSLSAVFDPFHQLDGKLNRKFSGTGLGLTISRSLCQLMGYELAIQSKHGKGSVFSIILAKHSAEPVYESEPAATVPARVRSTQLETNGSMLTSLHETANGRLLIDLQPFAHGQWGHLNLNRIALFSRNINQAFNAEQQKRYDNIKLEYKISTLPALNAIIEQASANELPHDIVESLRVHTRALEENFRSQDSEKTEAELAVELADEIPNHIDKVLQGIRTLRHQLLAEFQCNPVEIIDQTLRRIKPNLDREGINVETRYATGQYSVVINPPELDSIIELLVKTSSNAMVDRGEKALTFVSRVHLDRWLLEVSNSGNAIPLEQWNSLFTPTFHGNDSNGKFGLPEASALLQNYEGDLSVKTSTEGVGTTFLLRLKLLNVYANDHTGQ